MSIDSFLKELWYDISGRQLINNHHNMLSLDELKKTEWSIEFEQLMIECNGGSIDEEFITYMKNRLIMGAFRYGKLDSKKFSETDTISYMSRKISLYRLHNNIECLIDIANNCLLTYLKFKVADSKISHDIIKYHCPALLETALHSFNKTNDLAFLVVLSVLCMRKFIIDKKEGKVLECKDDKDHAIFYK